MKPLLTIVYPCYNPKRNWEKELVKNHREFTSRLFPGSIVQVILVNDGSAHEVSREQIDFIYARMPHLVYINNSEHSGKGHALRAAMKKINEGLVIYTDIDHPYSLENQLEMFRLLCDGTSDVVIGVRTRNYFRRLPLPRLIFSLALRFANYLFFPKMFVKDTQAGLKGFNQKGKEVFLKTRTNGFLFDAEFIRLCSKEDLDMKKITLRLNDGVTFSPVGAKVIWQEIRNFIRLLNRP